MTATEAVRERPILFSGEMVRAILYGPKTQTRRVMSPQPDTSLDYTKGRTVLRFARIGTDVKTGLMGWQAEDDRGPINAFHDGADSIKEDINCPYGKPGDQLWVRETFFDHGPAPGVAETLRDERIEYRAEPWERKGEDSEAGGWSSPIHMPRWASRLTLEVTGVRVQRVTEISAADAWAEGVRPAGIPMHPGDGTRDTVDPEGTVLEAFAQLWDSINAKRGYPFNSNPWVWAISFRVRGSGENAT